MQYIFLFIKIKLGMKKIFLFVIFLILPVFAYEIYSPDDYEYQSNGDKLLFVIDYSNSMSEHLGGKSKINQVKSVMKRILPQISPQTTVGLRVYGHTCNIIAYNACRSSELIVPMGINNNKKISYELENLRPRGMTPITYSLKQAINKDLLNQTGNKHIILLTDGGENCDESPCEYAIGLVKKRRDIKIDVIAFNVNDEDDLEQLRCTADVTGGNFTQADTQIELFRAVQNFVIPHKNVEATIYTGK